MSSGANLLVAIMATCLVAASGGRAIFFFFYNTNDSEPLAVWIFEVRKFGLCFCVFIQILESWFTRDLSFFIFFCKIVYGPKNGLGFLELKLLYVFFVKNLRGSVVKNHLIYVLNNIIYIFIYFFTYTNF